MRKLVLLAAAAALTVPAAASANGGPLAVYIQNHRQQAAPWFLYYPYGAYWNTPAPTGYATPPGPMTPGNYGSYHIPGPYNAGPQTYPYYQSTNGFGN